MKNQILFFLLYMSFVGCASESTAPVVFNEEFKVQFKSIAPSISKINFVNKVNEFDQSINYFSYNQIYIGAGVAAGDLNNDGLVDLFFQSTLRGGALYANKGDMVFESIPIDINLFNKRAAGTGINLVDVNNDGLLDVYLCYTGPTGIPKEDKGNKLLINQGNFQFVEAAAEYGLNDTGNSVQSSFFDYDKDGDLDMYLVNTCTELKYGQEVMPKEVLDFNHPLINQLNAQDKLYQNQGNGKFVDVTQSSGLVPEMFFGFNPTIGDYNNDNWPDVFVGNDFMTPDLLYINQQDGTFKEACSEYFKHTSFYTMGSDVGDINNDGLDDLLAVDMTPEDYKRSRLTMAMINVDLFNKAVKENYGRQYMHNMVQLNNGQKGFQEISQFLGVDKTDWSWAILNDDFDNNGYKDFYITNGIGRDITHKDLLDKRMRWGRENRNQMTYEGFVNLIKEIPAIPISNYLYMNQGDLSFRNETQKANIAIESFSNGAATADLDNDGDLDIVVNNFNQPAFLLENNSIPQNYIQFKLAGSANNKNGNGTKVCVHYTDQQQCNKMNVSRGFMSSTDYRVHFGLGLNDKVDFVEIIWPDDKYQRIENPAINTLNTLSYTNATGKKPETKSGPLLFSEVSNHSFHAHSENEYDDFQDQLLLPHKLSRLGPALVKGDVNGDGLEDVYIGGGTDQAGVVYLQNQAGEFIASSSKAFQTDKKYEDTDAILLDFDADGDLDLMVTSGSYEYKDKATELKDRLYLNDAKGNFSLYNYGTTVKANSMTITYADIDGDKDLDVFIGGRVIKGKYPFPPASFLLVNENGKLIDKTMELAPNLSEWGMVVDAEFVDIDKDNDMDLVLVGEWSPIGFFENNGGQFENKELPFAKGISGWWNTIEITDIDADGNEDLVLGNLGLNYKFSASEKKPLEVYCNDFDNTGTYDIVLAKPINNSLYPVRGKMCSSEQMPFLKEKFPTFTSFANANLYDIYGEGLKESIHLKSTKFESCVLLNKGGWNFDLIDLPPEAQLSPVNDVVSNDFNGDGKMDLLLGGNLFGSEVETTRGDAGIGLLLLGKGNGHFNSVNNRDSGFFTDGDLRRMAFVKGAKNCVIVVNNNDKAQQFILN